MQQLAKCILVLAWKMTMVGAQCPSEFNCSGTPECYLIYPSKYGWEYKNGDIDEADGWKYTDSERYIDRGLEESAEVTDASPNCYKFIRVTYGMGSCNDAQLECEKVGGSITVINSIQEYNQLTEIVLQILVNHLPPFTLTFYVQNLTRNGISHNECNKIKIARDKGVVITNIDCSTTQRVNAIVCESIVKYVNTEICSVPTTDAMETTPPLTATSSTTSASPPVHQTSLTWSSIANQALTTDETTAEHTSIRPIFTENQSEMEAGQSEREAGGNSWMVAVVASVVVIAIVIILLSFLFIRRRRTKPGYSPSQNQHLPSVGQPIEDGNQDRDVHQNTLYNAVGLDQDTADEVVCQDITNKIEYHDTAVEVEYQDTAVDVVYQNSGVDRSKRMINLNWKKQKELHAK